MDKFDRIQQLHRLLRSHRFPVPLKKLAERMECTEKTVRRTIETMQLQLDAPIEYDPTRRGWHYNEDHRERFELPGLWLTAGELQSLGLLVSLLENMGPGLLVEELKPVELEIEKLLHARGIEPNAFRKRVKVLPIAHRPLNTPIFRAISDALLNDRQVKIHYADFTDNLTRRGISPQTLVHYRENWYVDAWCHLRNGLRTFHLSRISCVTPLEQPRKHVSSAALKAHFSHAYGIFAGEAKDIARLRFDAAISREIAFQQWHPQQVGRWDGGQYLLSIPYADDRELIRDLLRLTPDVYVEAPVVLREKLQARLRQGLERNRE